MFINCYLDLYILFWFSYFILLLLCSFRKLMKVVKDFYIENGIKKLCTYCNAYKIDQIYTFTRNIDTK